MYHRGVPYYKTTIAYLGETPVVRCSAIVLRNYLEDTPIALGLTLLHLHSVKPLVNICDTEHYNLVVLSKYRASLTGFHL